MGKHWIASDFGGLDVFHLQDVEALRPGVGEVTIRVRAAGVNPVDFKHVAHGSDRSLLPIAVGHEVAGVISAIGAHTAISSGDGAIGDEVIAFRVQSGYASALTVDVKNVFAKPAALDTVGTDEAVDVSLALVADRSRIVTLAAMQRVDSVHTHVIRGALPANT